MIPAVTDDRARSLLEELDAVLPRALSDAARTTAMTNGHARARRRAAIYMISVVAKAYGIHPQTLRLYEREGLLKPSRTDGNTRLYSEDDLRQLEVILNLTRDLGVNLAGVEIVLNMRRKMEQMQGEVSEFVGWVRQELARAAQEGWQERLQQALVRLPKAPAAVERETAVGPPPRRSARRPAAPSSGRYNPAFPGERAWPRSRSVGSRRPRPTRSVRRSRPAARSRPTA